MLLKTKIEIWDHKALIFFRNICFLYNTVSESRRDYESYGSKHFPTAISSRELNCLLFTGRSINCLLLNRPIFFISELPSSLCVSSMVASWFFKNWNFTEEEFMKSLQWIFLYTFRNILIFALLILFALFDGLCFCLFLLWKDLLILQDLQKKKRSRELFYWLIYSPNIENWAMMKMEFWHPVIYLPVAAVTLLHLLMCITRNLYQKWRNWHWHSCSKYYTTMPNWLLK